METTKKHICITLNLFLAYLQLSDATGMVFGERQLFLFDLKEDNGISLCNFGPIDLKSIRIHKRIAMVTLMPALYTSVKIRQQ